MSEKPKEYLPPARLAGFFWLLTAAAGFFAEFYARPAVIVPQDAAATASKIMVSDSWLRIAFTSDLVAGLSYLAVAALLYRILKPVSRSFALLSAFFGFGGVVVSAATSVFLLAPAILLGHAPYLASFNPEQLQGLAFASIKFYAIGNHTAFMFYGLHIGSTGALILAANFLPRLIGLVLFVGGLGYLANSFVAFLAPEYFAQIVQYTIAPGGIGEIALALWLLLAGVNARRWQEYL
jgi:hypothetical protein